MDAAWRKASATSPAARAAVAAILSALLGLAGDAGAAGASTPPPDPADEPILTTFANGLKLLVLPRPGDAMVRVDVYIEPVRIEAPPGLAHLCEHLMFCSSTTAPRGSLADSLLLNGGTFNAGTTLEGIHLYGTCLPSRLPAALALEADRLGGLRPEPADLERERQRVLGEHDLRHEALPVDSLVLRVMAMAYADGRYAGDPLLGAPADIRAITMEDVGRFLSAALRPERTCVLVTGPVEPAEVAALAAEGLGRLPAAGALPGQAPLPPGRSLNEPWVQEAEIERDQLVVGFRLPCGTEQELALAHLAAVIMARESGDPALHFRGDEVLLTVHIEGDWTGDGPADEGAARAVAAFWDSTRRVLHNVADAWLFNRNRTAGLEEFRESMSDPRTRADWRAQRLASGRAMPEPEVLAAVIDTLGHGLVAGYFKANITREGAFAAMAVARAPDDQWLADLRRFLRLEVNPYLDEGRAGSGLDAARIEPLLAAAAGLALPTVATSALPGGEPLHVVTMPGEVVLVAAARTFVPDLGGGDNRSRSSRLALLDWLACCGYSSSGARLEPRGFELGSAAQVSLAPGSVNVVGGGVAGDVRTVAADICKRLHVWDLSPDALRAFQAALPPMGAKPPARPYAEAARACIARTHGPQSALAWWSTPDLDEIRDWSVGQAERQLAAMLKGDGYRIVVVGATGDGDVAAALREPVSRLRRGDGETEVVALPPAVGTGSGCVVHDALPDVATILFLGGGYEPEATAGLGATDLDVLARIVTRRVEAAAASAGLDSLVVDVIPQAVGPLVLPWVRVGVPAHRVGAAVPFVRAQLEGLATRPIDRDEEAQARLLLLGPLVELLGDAGGMMSHVLATAARGPVPARPLDDLCRLRTDLLARCAGDVFAPGRGAFAVIGDTTTVAIRQMLAELGGP